MEIQIVRTFTSAHKMGQERRIYIDPETFQWLETLKYMHLLSSWGRFGVVMHLQILRASTVTVSQACWTFKAENGLVIHHRIRKWPWLKFAGLLFRRSVLINLFKVHQLSYQVVKYTNNRVTGSPPRMRHCRRCRMNERGDFMAGITGIYAHFYAGCRKAKMSDTTTLAKGP